MNAADEADGAGRKWSLIVAEIGSGASEGNGEIMDFDGLTEIADARSGRARLAEDGENFAAPIDDGDDHAGSIDGCGGGHHDTVHVRGTQRSNGGRRDIRSAASGSAAATAAAEQQKCEGGSKTEKQRGGKDDSMTALLISAPAHHLFAESVIHRTGCNRIYHVETERSIGDKWERRQVVNGRGVAKGIVQGVGQGWGTVIEAFIENSQCEGKSWTRRDESCLVYEEIQTVYGPT